MTSLSQVIQSIVTRKYKFCCLCLKVIEKTSVNIQDEIIVKEDDNESAIKIFDVLGYVLGVDVSNNISAFEFLCKPCTHTAVTCYKFISTCKNNIELLTNALFSLNDCFETVVTDAFDCNTLFVTLDSNLSTQQYYGNKHAKSFNSNAFQRFQAIVDNNPKFQKNILVKVENKKQHEPLLKTKSLVKEDDLEKRKNVEKKRRNYLAVPIRTKDMLYDKNDRTNLKCKVCLKSYPTLSNLRNHFIRVHAPKNYKCSMCNRKFGSLALLDNHKSESHCTLICTECGKTFHNRHTLKMHEIGHYLKLICQDCGRVYKSQTTFKKHIDLNICGQKTRASPADAKFTCDYCNKKYTQKVSLRVHIQYEHGNYKGHECKWCKKKFWAKSRLNAHIVKHTQEKKFHCTLCGGKYVTKESLLYHTRTHTGEKPYKCDFCDSRFLSASRRSDHIKRQHTDLTFQCDICNVKYTTQLCLEKHKKTHNKPDKSLLQISNHIHITDGVEIFMEASDEDDYNMT